MKQIRSFSETTDGIEYWLWVNDKGELYVQFKKKEGGTNSDNLLFPVSEYEQQRNSPNSIGYPKGLDMNNNYSLVQSANNNDGGFLKAVLRDLLP